VGTSTRPGGAARTIRQILVAIVLLALLNEAAQYSIAWSRIFLATRDARAALVQSIRARPTDRDAAAVAAQAACEKRKVTLTAYDHAVDSTELGPRVNVRLDVETRARAAVLTAFLGAMIEDGTLATWRGRAPMVRYTYRQRFFAYE
jgi:hypothetical protein